MTEDDKRTGYGRPPKDKQFRKGQSGNPRGRPRGAKDPNQIFRKVLDRQLTLTVNGEKRKMTIRKGLVLSVRELAKSGDPKAMKWVRRMMEHAHYAGPGAIDGGSAEDPRKILIEKLEAIARNHRIWEQLRYEETK